MKRYINLTEHVFQEGVVLDPPGLWNEEEQVWVGKSPESGIYWGNIIAWSRVSSELGYDEMSISLRWLDNRLVIYLPGWPDAFFIERRTDASKPDTLSELLATLCLTDLRRLRVDYYAKGDIENASLLRKCCDEALQAGRPTLFSVMIAIIQQKKECDVTATEGVISCFSAFTLAKILLSQPPKQLLDKAPEVSSSPKILLSQPPKQLLDKAPEVSLSEPPKPGVNRRGWAIGATLAYAGSAISLVSAFCFYPPLKSMVIPLLSASVKVNPWGFALLASLGVLLLILGSMMVRECVVQKQSMTASTHSVMKGRSSAPAGSSALKV